MNMNTNDLPLFQQSDFAERQARDAAINQVEENNSPSPIDAAMEEAERNLALLPLHVTCDIILPDIKKFGFTDGRAVGAIMRKLAKSGMIEPTENYRQSTRKGNHRVPRRVYLNHCKQ